MDLHSALAFALPISLCITALGVATALGNAVANALQALARQPYAFGKIMTLMLLGAALIETIIFYFLAFVVFPLIGKI